MKVHNLDLVRIAVRPVEANAPLIVDPNAVLASAIALQPLQPISRWHAEILKPLRRIDDHQLAEHCAEEIGRKATDPLPREKSLRVPVTEALDHLEI